MRIVVVGGNGGTGAQVVRRALERGDEVVSVSRSGWEDAPAGLVDARADATVSAELDPILRGADAVVLAVGAPGLASDRPRTRATASVVAAMRRVGVKRLVVHSSLGVGDSLALMKEPIRSIAKVMLGRALADHADQEALVSVSGLDWTVVRPAGLSDEPYSGRFTTVATEQARVGEASGRIGRADVAAGILDALDHDTRGALVFVRR